MYGINNYNQLAGQFTGGNGPYTFQGLLDYYTPTGGDRPFLVSPAGLMSSLNNQCNYLNCTYQSPFPNVAVGYQVPVPELHAGPTAVPFRRGQAAPDNTPSPANGSCGPPRRDVRSRTVARDADLAIQLFESECACFRAEWSER